MSISVFILRPWKSEKHQRVPPLKMKKIFVSDFYEIQNMQSLWPKDFTHKIWVESETKFFFWFKGGTLWWFFENQKNTKGSPLWKKKIFCLRFYSNFMCEILRPLGFQILSFIKKNFFLIFSHFHLMLKDPQKFSTSNFFNFLKIKHQNWLSGTWQIWKGTKSGSLVNIALTRRQQQTDSW